MKHKSHLQICWANVSSSIQMITKTDNFVDERPLTAIAVNGNGKITERTPKSKQIGQPFYLFLISKQN